MWLVDVVKAREVLVRALDCIAVKAREQHSEVSVGSRMTDVNRFHTEEGVHLHVLQPHLCALGMREQRGVPVDRGRIGR